MLIKNRLESTQQSLCQSHLISIRALNVHQAAPEIEGMIGESEQMKALRLAISLVARCQSTVLITGESGTGKELTARAIHNLGERRDKSFKAVNCGALTETLLEAELFGHVKGAFTGAVANRKGLFEATNGGTIFLDEIGDMSPSMQVKLLRVLQERKVTPVGAQDERAIDVRVIAATNRDLRQMVRAGTFREDLYFRLAIIPVETPPLKTRRADIEALTRHLLKVVCQKAGRTKPSEITPSAMSALRDYQWPGNVRELMNVLERLTATIPEEEPINFEDVRLALNNGNDIIETVTAKFTPKRVSETVGV